MGSPQVDHEIMKIRKVLEAININLTSIARSLQAKNPEGDSQEKQGS